MGRPLQHSSLSWNFHMSKNTFSPLLLDSYEKGCDMANFDFKYLS